MTTLWLDADACPKLIREICFRAAERCQVHLYLVANQPIAHPPSPWLHKLVVSSGFDAPTTPSSSGRWLVILR